ncbi:hypothetical protein FACS1894151_07990 [Spirochaetia bacterium]|nr:hypothetical protein FACS1894151_07990 [Spirochaetia bacterium]
MYLVLDTNTIIDFLKEKSTAFDLLTLLVMRGIAVIAIEQTLNVPSDRRVTFTFTVPETVEPGDVKTILIFPNAVSANNGFPESSGVEREQTIEECLAEAAAKAQYYKQHPEKDRYYDGKPFDTFGKTMEDVVAWQRSVRAEWDD